MALACFPMTTVTARRKAAEAAAAKPARKRSRKPATPAVKGVSTAETLAPPASDAASKGITTGDTLALPTPVAAEAAELDRFRAEFKRHRDVAVWAAGKAEFAAALDRAIIRLGSDRAAMTPARWVEAVEAVRLFCERCQGSGDYVWGGSVNGRPAHKATCYHCEGKGEQTIEDAHRNRVYMRHAIRAAAGF